MIRNYIQKNHIVRIVLGSACIGVCIYFLVMLLNSLFSLQSVEVVGTTITIEINKNFIHSNLLFIPTGKLRLQLLKDYVLLSDVEIQKKFPHTIRIIPHVRLPIARLRSQANMVLIDRDGWVVGDDDNSTSLPVLEFDIGNAYIGKQIQDPGVLSSLAFITSIDQNTHIQNITRLDNASLHVTSDRIDIYIPQLGDMKRQAATLQTLVTGFRMKGKLPVTVDLRFDKPVVKF